MREILVIKPSSFGDIIHGLQVMNEYRSQEKNLRITWIVRDTFASIVKASDAVDDVLTFERMGGVGAYLKLLKNIREKYYDYVIDLQGLARTAVWTFAARGREKIGRSDAREAATLAYSSLIPLPKNKKAHAIEILLELLAVLGYPVQLNTRLTFSKAQTSEFIQKTVLDSEPYILVFPDSRRKEKVWPYFYQLIEHFLLVNKGYKIILAGNDEAQKYSMLPRERVINLIGKTEMTDLISLIEKCSLVITNDSGPMHLAVAMDAKVLALFGPTDPLQFGPYPLYSKNHYVLRAPSSNMEELTVANVMQTLNEMLEKNYEFSQAVAKC